MEKFCVNDNCYNVAKQLSKKLEFLNHVDKYIEDSKKEGKENSGKIWEMIKNDEIKHTELLHDLLAEEIKH